MAKFRRLVKRLAWALAIVLGVVVVHALVAVFPQPLFRHRVTHGNLEGLSFVEILARPPDPWTVHRKVAAILDRDPAALLEHLEPVR